MRVGMDLSLSSSRKSRGFGNHSTLSNGLVSAWPLSADGHDAVGANHLTNNNAVTFVAKGGGSPANMPATVANFVTGSAQYFRKSTVAPLGNPALGFTISLWTVMTAATPDFSGLVSHYAAGVPNNFVLLARSTPAVRYSMTDSSNSAIDSTGFTLGVWAQLIAWYDPADQKIRIRLNDTTTVTSASAITLSPSPGALDLSIGRVANAAAFDGNASSVYIWYRVLTAAERTALYNSGNGLFY